MFYKPGQVGFTDFANSCYCNASLQILLHTPYAELFETICLKFNQKTESTRTILKIPKTTLATILGEQYNGQTAQAALHFQENLAEDVNQVNYPEPFGNVYLDYEKNIVKKANDYQANHRRNMSSSVNGMFRAVQVIILPCTCSVDKLSLNVNVKFDDGLSLLGCLERYFQTWTTNESCIRCAKSQLPARAYLWNLPPILIIHLGRWNRYVSNLYFQQHHIVDPSNGHFTTKVKNIETKEWMWCNDTIISEINVAQVKTADAFMLYYKRMDGQAFFFNFNKI
uniref:ubiquitinyl hydrolase 1 n=1 Tax=Meloidogyne enterolobii TaxID=390850 RepID=A0A6V7VAE1_MELEN|nr:unnamed protein product [Meloidogyne enterolobii]